MIADAFDLTRSKELNHLQDLRSGVQGLSNAIGLFHQRVLGSIRGWVNHDSGYDLESPGRKIVAEIKNKHNTPNKDNRIAVLTNLSMAIRNKRGQWQGYLVYILPKRPERFTLPIAGRPGVFEIDGASFYHLATGQANALHDLFDEVCLMLSSKKQIASYCRQIMEESLPPRLD